MFLGRDAMMASFVLLRDLSDTHGVGVAKVDRQSIGLGLGPAQGVGHSLTSEGAEAKMTTRSRDTSDPPEYSSALL
jgi:hypothetical protein